MKLYPGVFVAVLYDSDVRFVFLKLVVHSKIRPLSLDRRFLMTAEVMFSPGIPVSSPSTTAEWLSRFFHVIAGVKYPRYLMEHSRCILSPSTIVVWLSVFTTQTGSDSENKKPLAALLNNDANMLVYMYLVI